jgi:hypothetical protein
MVFRSGKAYLEPVGTSEKGGLAILYIKCSHVYMCNYSGSTGSTVKNQRLTIGSETGSTLVPKRLKFHF